MVSRKDALIHLRTGEPGSGKTINTVNEVLIKHPDEVVYYTNAKSIDLPKWQRKDLFNLSDEELQSMSKQKTIWFIDDFYYDMANRTRIDVMLFVKRLPKHADVYLVLEDIDILDKETQFSLLRSRIDHQKYKRVRGDRACSDLFSWDDKLVKRIKINADLFDRFEGVSRSQAFKLDLSEQPKTAIIKSDYLFIAATDMSVTFNSQYADRLQELTKNINKVLRNKPNVLHWFPYRPGRSASTDTAIDITSDTNKSVSITVQVDTQVGFPNYAAYDKPYCDSESFEICLLDTVDIHYLVLWLADSLGLNQACLEQQAISFSKKGDI